MSDNNKNERIVSLEIFAGALIVSTIIFTQFSHDCNPKPTKPKTTTTTTEENGMLVITIGDKVYRCYANSKYYHWYKSNGKSVGIGAWPWSMDNDELTSLWRAASWVEPPPTVEEQAESSYTHTAITP